MKVLGGRFLNSEELRRSGVRSVGERVMVHETAILVDLDRIEIGSDVRIDPFCVLSAAEGHIRLGNYIHVAAQACIYGSAGVDMEDFSGLSHGVKVYSASDDYSGRSLTNPTVPREYLRTIKGPVRLGRHVIVGSGSIILPRVTIAEGSSVGALSLVSKSLESWGVYSGVPARRLKDRRKDLLEGERSLLGRADGQG
jgi:acetyltransferase-like isoleucine patch superfamily enzyme